jgi:hypothetical protein
MLNNNDTLILRNLAEKVSEISKKPIQDEKRELWRKNNSLIKTRPLVYMQTGSWDAMGTEVINDMLECKDPVFREIEFKLRFSILKDDIGDDEIVEPWVTVDPVFASSGWGFESHNLMPDHKGGAHKLIACIKEMDDIKHFKVPKHEIDAVKTNERYNLIEEAIGDIIEVDRGRGTWYMYWGGDISTCLAQLVGLEELMYHVYDRPEWMHEILAFMRDGILKAQQEAEDAGDWTRTCHTSQAMTYDNELLNPKANSGPVTRDKLWGFFAAQEFALISPDMHEEFMLNYQLPIMKKFGLTSYGCCEDLTRKIEFLRKVPNLRRISVSPWADIGKCAEQIQRDYVLSWRPNPSSTICNGWDPDLIRKTVKEAMEASKGCNVDITLKDVQTVQGEAWRFKEWIKVVRDVSDNY